MAGKTNFLRLRGQQSRDQNDSPGAASRSKTNRVRTYMVGFRQPRRMACESLEPRMMLTSLVQSFFHPTQDNGQEGGQFGYRVATDVDYHVVGSSQADADGFGASGIVHVFDMTTGDLVATLNNPTPGDQDYFGDSVAVSGSHVVVGARRDDSAGLSNNGAAYVFDAATGDLVTTLVSPSLDSGDEFGWSVAIAGTAIVVGSRNDDTTGSNSGQAYVFDALTGSLITTLANPTPAASDAFGYSVAILGNTAVVGAVGDDPDGAAYVFNATTGALVATLANPTPASGDSFGVVVAISGNTVVVGASADDTGATNSGQAYLFTATTGELLTTLTNPTPGEGDFFGRAVAISGNTAVVGAYGDDAGAEESGRVYTFDATNGALLATMTNPSPDEGDWFGNQLAVSGNSILIGAPRDDTGKSDIGQAYIFDATSGSLMSTLVNPTPASDDQLGRAVAVSGNRMVGGAPYDDTGGTDSGQAFVFDASTGTLIATLANPTPAEDDLFGNAVAISGDLVVVGALRDDTDGSNSGQAYLFQASTGALLATLANPAPFGDNFGAAVAIEGDRVVVGSPRHRDALGQPQIGRAYVFDANTGLLTSTLFNPGGVGDLFGQAVAISGDKVIVGAPME